MRNKVAWFTPALLAGLLAAPLPGQFPDVGAVVGAGYSTGDDQDSAGVTAVGVSVGWPHSFRHRLQADYLLQNVRLDLSSRRHYFTGSYVLQLSPGRLRPFFQFGAGIVSRTFSTRSFLPPDSVFERSESESGFAVLFGAGATVDIGRPLFLRPQVRLYGHAGPTMTLLPALEVGFRF